MILHSVDDGDEMLAAWDEWSQQSAKYQPGACERKWQSFNGERGDVAGIGTLIHWAKTDSNGAFKPRPTDATRCTDLGNARRLVLRHGGDMRHTPDAGWYAWDGMRWARDTTGAVVRHAKDIVRQILIGAADIEDGDLQKAVTRWGLQSQAEPRIAAMVKLARTEPEIAVDQSVFDTGPMLLNVRNGTLNLRTRELLPHDRAHLITKCCPVEFDPAAAAARWAAFLDRIMASDADLIAYLQRAVGYTLTGKTSERAFFILHGQGDNGKSVFISTIRALLGDYARQTAADTLMIKRHPGVGNDIARLAGARLVTAVETNEGQRFDESLIKGMTGGSDDLTARYLYHEPFEFTPHFKLWLACNHRPDVRDTTSSTWNRIRLIPFTVTIPEPEQDKDLAEKLVDDLPGILNWAVDGCVAWQAGGLQTPKKVSDATIEYRSDNDILGQWIGERCELADDAEESAVELHRNYANWCEDAGHRPLGRNKFGRRLGDRGFAKEKAPNIRYQGICIRPLSNQGVQDA